MLINGVHSSPLEPEVLWNWIAFLDLYVAHKQPNTGRLAPFASTIYEQILGVERADAAPPARSLRGAPTVRPARSASSSRAARARPDGERRGLVDAGPPGAALRARLREVAAAGRAPDRMVLRSRRNAHLESTANGRLRYATIPIPRRVRCRRSWAGTVGVLGSDAGLRLASARSGTARRVRDRRRSSETRTIVGEARRSASSARAPPTPISR